MAALLRKRLIAGGGGAEPGERWHWKRTGGGAGDTSDGARVRRTGAGQACVGRRYRHASAAVHGLHSPRIPVRVVMKPVRCSRHRHTHGATRAHRPSEYRHSIGIGSLGRWASTRCSRGCATWGCGGTRMLCALSGVRARETAPSAVYGGYGAGCCLRASPRPAHASRGSRPPPPRARCSNAPSTPEPPLRMRSGTCCLPRPRVWVPSPIRRPALLPLETAHGDVAIALPSSRRDIAHARGWRSRQ